MSETTNYSSEGRRKERDEAQRVLKEFKEIEKLYKKFRRKEFEKTPCGIKIKYVKP